MSLESTSIRPEDNAFNIQCKQPLSYISMEDLHSTSPSPMDESFLSEIDYAERVAFANNTEVETLNPSLPVNNTVLSYNFILPLPNYYMSATKRYPYLCLIASPIYC